MTDGDAERRARWERVKRIVADAEEIAPEALHEFLERETAGDEQLRREVEDLLSTTPLALDLAASHSEMDLDPLPEGAHVGEFRVVRRIGSGGMGAVYLAEQEGLGRRVALKLLLPGLTAKPSDVDRFRREARAAGRLKHPNIVRIHTSGFHPELRACWFAMDHIEGHDLAQEITLQRGERVGDERAVLPTANTPEYFRAVASLVRDVARALQHAHEHQIVHRDVKPMNLLLDRSGHVYVADFGLARDERFGEVTRSRHAMGTLHYMSPEQIDAARSVVDQRTDVYSLGVVLYELLSLRRPFEGASEIEVIDRIHRGEVRAVEALNPRVPRALARVSRRAMAREVEARYGSGAQLADDLARYLDGQAVSATDPSWIERTGRALATRRNWLLGAGSVLAAASSFYMIGRTANAGSKVHVVVRTPGPAVVVSVRRIDPSNWQMEPVQELGQGVAVEGDLVPGFYRVAVRFDDSTIIERPWVLRPSTESAEIEVSAVSRASAAPMIEIPAGACLVGAEAVRAGPFVRRKYDLGSFAVDRYLVSNADYVPFARDTGRRLPRYWLPALETELANRPVADVPHADAMAYAEAIGKRLPDTYEFWRYSRGTDGARLPWRDKPLPTGPCAPWEQPEHRISWLTLEESIVAYRRMTRDVDSCPEAASECGAFHTFGNVFEMTLSPVTVEDHGRFDPIPNAYYVMGGSWTFDPRTDGLDAITSIEGERSQFDVGFRCVRSR